MTALLVVLVIAAIVVTTAAVVVVYVRSRTARLSGGSLLAPPASGKSSQPPRAGSDDASQSRSSTAVLEAEPDSSPSQDAAALVEIPGGDPARSGIGEDVAAPPRRLWSSRLAKAREALGTALAGVLRRSTIDAGAWDALEEALLGADVGVKMTMELVSRVERAARSQNLSEPEDLIKLVKSEIVAVLDGKDRSLARSDTLPTVYLFAGVNGTGKTTSIAKLAKRLTDAKESVVLAAADTFRAAATEQLAIWAERVGAQLVKGSEGADPGAVVFDAIGYARARGASYLLVDTAGRLHTNQNLMEELKKVARVASKAGAPPAETLLVIDATTGQNGLSQAARFKDAVQITGIVLTKLDGSARGGIVIAIEDQLGVPVKFVGVGEGADDLVPFDPEEFADALFDESIRRA